MESEFSVVFLISGVSRDFQHLLFAYCSLNGKGLFTGIDGSWKLKNVMVLGYDSMNIFVSSIHLHFIKRLADLQCCTVAWHVCEKIFFFNEAK